MRQKNRNIQSRVSISSKVQIWAFFIHHHKFCHSPLDCSKTPMVCLLGRLQCMWRHLESPKASGDHVIYTSPFSKNRSILSLRLFVCPEAHFECSIADNDKYSSSLTIYHLLPYEHEFVDDDDETWDQARGIQCRIPNITITHRLGSRYTINVQSLTNHLSELPTHLSMLMTTLIISCALQIDKGAQASSTLVVKYIKPPTSSWMISSSYCKMELLVCTIASGLEQLSRRDLQWNLKFLQTYLVLMVCWWTHLLFV